MKHWLFLILILVTYLLKLFFVNPEIFNYRFNDNLIKKYFCSQDITKEVPCPRVFLSDGDLHIAAGYLYVKGYDPSQYHFQHAPFLKYLYGLTILLFHNPYYLEISLVMMYLIVSFVFTLKIFKSYAVAILTTLFLSLGPLLRILAGDLSFDVGQAVLMLMYGMAVILRPKNFILQGILLALFAGAKFWGAMPFFMIAFNGFNLINKKFNLKEFILQLVIAFIVFSSFYTVTFINEKGDFNIIFFQLKIFKYWITHSLSKTPFASLILFLTGYYKSWWEMKDIVKGEVWNLLWPLSFIVASYKLFKDVVKKQINKKTLFAFIPIAYLFYLGAQAAFVRYFILILPFFYSTMINEIISYSSSNKTSEKNRRRK